MTTMTNEDNNVSEDNDTDSNDDVKYNKVKGAL